MNRIHLMHHAGQTPYAIAQALGISKNTAKKYITQGPKPHAAKGKKRGSKLDPYKDAVLSMVSEGIYNCEVIYERIREQGYCGAITILKDFIQPLRPSKKAPAVRRYETSFGKQAQMDWGIASFVDSNGVSHKVPVFVMVLGRSRTAYAEFAKRCDIHSLLHCMVNAFEYFDGIPETVLTDRMKTVVLGSEGGSILWHKQFEDFAALMGFVPKLCRVRRPQTKGKVERLVRYVKENFLPGRRFTDLNDLNTQVRLWSDAKNWRVHGTTGEMPFAELAKENLLPLPAQQVRDRYRWETRKVSRDGFVSYDGAKYGVPWQYSGTELRVRVLTGLFEAYAGDVRVLRCPIEYRSGKLTYLKEQYNGLAEKGGYANPRPHAWQISSTEVETRPLAIYARLAEAGSNG